MIRSAVLTLGAIFMFGGASAAQADDLSSSPSPFLADWPLLSPVPPSGTGVFPKLPENWSDLPFQLHISEVAGYNSNIANTPTGSGVSAAVYGRPVGALETISSYGVSFKNEIGGQQLFADATWGMYRYLNNDRFNTAHSAVDLGDNFTYGSKCSGTLRAAETSVPSEPGQQLAYNVVNTLTTASLTENAKCIVTGEYAAIINSGASKSINSDYLDKQNDFQSAFIAAGMSYNVSETNSLQLLATLNGTDYTDRQASPGLVSKLTTDSIMATYTKDFGPNLALNAQFGILGVNDEYFSFGLPRTILPEYAFSVQWVATPKLSLNVAASRQAAPPTSILSNLQVTETASVGFAYHWTPKVSFKANLQTSYATSAATSALTTTYLGVYAANQHTYSGGATVSYAISPFLAASLSYQYTKSVQSIQTTNDSLILLALNFNPY